MWIKVKDKLPDEDEHILLYFESGGLENVSVGFLIMDDKWQEINGDSHDETDYPPSHWQPLPEPPND